jgi:hypothetical protein
MGKLRKFKLGRLMESCYRPQLDPGGFVAGKKANK